MSVRAFFEDHICPLPGIVIEETPLMATANVVDGQQDLSRVNRECLSIRGGKLENAPESEDVLQRGSVVPVEVGMHRRFLELDRLRFDEHPCADAALFDVGIAV